MYWLRRLAANDRSEALRIQSPAIAVFDAVCVGDGLAPMKTVLVIGAGFCGVATTVQLLRRARLPSGLRIVMLNRSSVMARGLAYGTNSSSHLLNVPAGNMSALPEEPESFLRYCVKQDPAVIAGTFVPRSRYGDYLGDLLRDAEQAAAPQTIVEQIVGQACDLELFATLSRARVRLASGATIEADRVVLAAGNYAPSDPPIPDRAFFRSERYVRDPWSANAMSKVPDDAPVLLVGTGLTALDVCLSLAERGRRSPIICVSRRGLLPQAHRPGLSAPPSGDLPPSLLEGAPRVSRYLRDVRRHIARRAAAGVDWRDVVASLRPVTPRIWELLDQVERRRFLRHLQVFWDVHRHRAAPEPHQRFLDLSVAGRVRALAGRIVEVEEANDGIRVIVRRRGTGERESMTVGAIVNCTGPNCDITALGDPLLDRLQASGLARPDPLRLGIDVDERLALLGADGRASRVLYYIGPMLRARYWEATAVPELRQHASMLADYMLASLRDTQPEGVS